MLNLLNSLNLLNESYHVFMDSAITVIFQLAILMFSVVIHEVAHGLAANALGDPTAKYAGRLTLNPLKHLDPIGSVAVPLISILFGGAFIGWARPVPYNPYNLSLRNKELGSAIVGGAGPLANIAVAVFFGLAVRVLAPWAAGVEALGFMVQMAVFIVVINLWLAVFNLMPIPPLDGSKIAFLFLPPRYAHLKIALEQFGFFIVLALVFFVPSLFIWLSGAVRFLVRFIVGA